jgi:hypothetical protein
MLPFLGCMHAACTLHSRMPASTSKQVTGGSPQALTAETQTHALQTYSHESKYQDVIILTHRWVDPQALNAGTHTCMDTPRSQVHFMTAHLPVGPQALMFSTQARASHTQLP